MKKMLCGLVSAAALTLVQAPANTQEIGPDLGSPQAAGPIVTSILPIARGTEPNRVVSAFATLINSGDQTATNCFPALDNPSRNETFSFQTTNALNQLTGTPNTPFSIPSGGAQSLAFFYTWTANAGISPNHELIFDCGNTSPAAVVQGLNTFSTEVIVGRDYADMIAISATDDNDGYLDIDGDTGIGFAFVSVVNIGDGMTIRAKASKRPLNTLERRYSADLSICRLTNGVCVSGYRSDETFTATPNVPFSFGIRAVGTGRVEDRADINRVYVYFEDEFGRDLFGATSFAIRTRPQP